MIPNEYKAADFILKQLKEFKDYAGINAAAEESKQFGNYDDFFDKILLKTTNRYSKLTTSELHAAIDLLKNDGYITKEHVLTGRGRLFIKYYGYLGRRIYKTTGFIVAVIVFCITVGPCMKECSNNGKKEHESEQKLQLKEE